METRWGDENKVKHARSTPVDAHQYAARIVHVLLEILLEVFEHERQRLRRVNYVVQRHNVGMLEL